MLTKNVSTSNNFLKIILLWMTGIYFFQFGLAVIFSKSLIDYESIYVFHYDFIYVGAFLLLFTALIIFCNKIFNSRFKRIKLASDFSLFIDFLIYCLSISFLILAIYFYMNVGIGFRQNQELSSNYLVALLVLMKSFLPIIAIVMLASIFKTSVFPNSYRFYFLATSIGSIIAIDESLTAIYCAVFLILPLCSYTTLKKIFLERLSIRLLVAFFMAGSLLVIVVIYAGFANKGVPFEFLGSTLKYILLRTSSHYVTLHNAIGFNLFDTILQFEAIEQTFQLFQDRFSKILGSPLNTEVIGIDRLNYETNYLIIDLPRAGSSPGLIASFLYIPFFPINIILLIIYLFILSLFLNSILVNKLNIAGIVLFTYLLRDFFESPLQLFNIVEIFTIKFILLCTLSIFYIKKSD